MRTAAAMLAVLTAVVAHQSNEVQQPLASQKAETEAILNAGLPFARRELEAHGEFFPFAMAMTLDSKVAAVAVQMPEERPASQKVIEELIAALKIGVARKQYKATGIFVDTRVQPAGKQAKIDAVRISLEHAGGYCADVHVPYLLSSTNKVAFEQPFATKRAGEVFPACK